MTNNLFFGRANLLQMLRQGVFEVPEGSQGSCLSLCGPHGIGKTFLIDQLITEFEQRRHRQPQRKEFCFCTSILSAGERTQVDLQCELLSLFAGKIKPRHLNALLEQARNDPEMDEMDLEDIEDAVENLLNAYALPDARPNRGAPGYDSWVGKVNRAMDSKGSSSVFLNYTLLGYRIILILDEFDRAQKAFPTGDIFQWLFNLTPKANNRADRPNLSIVLLSRRRAGKIAHHMAEGSSFESAFPPHPLAGFSNRELEDYFNSYAELPCGIPNNEQYHQILYRCGRHPALLMSMRDEAALQPDNNWSVNRIWRSNPGRFQSVYEKMCDQLQSEPATRLANATMMDALMYQFEFFAVEDETYHERLIDSGFATAVLDTDAVIDPETGTLYYPDIYVLSGVKDIRDSLEPLVCEPLSPYFLDYVRQVWKPDRQRSVADYLALTERDLRQFLAEGLRSRYGNGWKEAAEAALPVANKQPYLQKLQDMAALNGYTGDLSILDVLGFNDYMSIILANWSGLFCRSFACYGLNEQEAITNLTEAMEFLRSCRNTNAHGSIKVLNASHLTRLQETCDKLNAVLAGDAPQSEPAGQTEPAAAVPAPKRTASKRATTLTPEQTAFLEQINVDRFYPDKDKDDSYRADLLVNGVPLCGVLIKKNGNTVDAYPPQNIWPYKEQLPWSNVRNMMREPFELWLSQQG